jgi:hypothetical protein
MKDKIQDMQIISYLQPEAMFLHYICHPKYKLPLFDIVLDLLYIPYMPFMLHH